MADRWQDDRDDRAWRERERLARRYDRSDAYDREDYTQRDYALGDFDTGYRSFEPQETRRGPRGPVFGERESGADYTGRETGRCRDYRDQTFSARSSYGRSEDAPPRYYGDDGRAPLYRSDLTSTSPSDRTYADYRPEPPRNDREFGADRGYRTERYERDREDRNDGRSFWDRASQRVASWFGEYDADDRERDRHRDTRQFGHRGRGPQGYKRADERINDEAHERLTDDPWVDATNLSISVSGGEVTLSGTVESREAKHRAERIVEDISGVNHVQNNIRVDRGNFLTNPGRGFGDSANEALMRDQAKTGDRGLTLDPSNKGASRTQ